MNPQRTDVRRPVRTSCLLGLLLCGVFAFGAGDSAAGTPVQYVGAFREQIDETFFEPAPASLPTGTRVSREKVAAYRAMLEKKHRFLLALVATHETIEEGKSAKKAAKTARKTDLAVALRVALEDLERLDEEIEIGAAYDTAARILMIEYATRSYTNPLSSIKISTHLKNMFNSWSVPASTKAGRVDAEAGNLVDPSDGSFFTREELADLVRAGSDLSELNPPDETPFWSRRADIAAVDIRSNYLEGGDPVHGGIASEFPPFDGAVVELAGLRLTQSKPKADVYYDDPRCLAAGGKRKECRQRIKLKFGMEVHADPPANALISALGFNTDVSMPLRNIRVYLGDWTLDEVERQWTGYFDRQRLHIYYPLHSVLVPGEAGHGRDERGEYVVFREAVAEVKPSEIDRIGFFSFSSGMATNAREARGLTMFNAWIANADMKDDENNKLSLRKDADGVWRMFLIQQDLGHSFGYILPEKAQSYPWDIIDQDPFSRLMGKLRGRIELTYLDLQNNGLEDTTTYADAKWMVRLIAQLTKEQIDTAIRLGDWPDAVAQLYTEKLANRRNEMVRAFGLEAEFEPLPVDRGLTTADGAVVDGELVQSRWDGSIMRYGEHWSDLLRPVGRYLLDVGIWAVQSGAGSVDRIDPGRIRIGNRFVINPGILIELDRQVTFNPAPTALFDQYIVQDTVAIGIDVAAGYYASVEGAYMKRYAMAYPAPTRREGLLGGNRVLSLFMPLDVRRGNLPDEYVLLREDSFAAGARVSSEDSGTIYNVLGGDASINRVVRRRSVVDRRGEVPLVWVDQPEYWRARARAFLKADILEIPFAGGQVDLGALEGFAWQLDPEKLDRVGSDGTPIFERLIQHDDPSELDAIRLREPTRVTSQFDTRDVHWSIYLLGARHERRDETIVHATPEGETQRAEFQTERRHGWHWQFLDNGESQGIEITGYNSAAELSELEREGETLVTRYRIEDRNAHSDEFNGYYDLLTQLGVLDPVAARDFDAMEWEITGEPSGHWLHLFTNADLHYRVEALERLLAVRESDFWPALADELGISRQRILRLVERVRRSDRRLGARAVPGATRRERTAIGRALRVFDRLADARQADDERSRLHSLVAAMERANFRIGHTFDPCVVAALHRNIDIDGLVRDGAVYLRGSIGRALEDELNLPERRTVVGERGEAGRLRETSYRFFPRNGIDLYNMLDWIRADAPKN